MRPEGKHWQAAQRLLRYEASREDRRLLVDYLNACHEEIRITGCELEKRSLKKAVRAIVRWSASDAVWIRKWLIKLLGSMK